MNQNYTVKIDLKEKFGYIAVRSYKRRWWWFDKIVFEFRTKKK